MDPRNKVGSSKYSRDSEGSEVSGGPVHRIISESYYDDGSKHTTESVVTNESSSRMSWDTDPDGNTSDFHQNRN